MCGLVLLSESGEVVEQGAPNTSDVVYIGVGRLLKSDNGADIEIARLRNEGCRNFEIVSDRVVEGSFEEVQRALQELGFVLLENVCRKIFDYIQLSLGSPRKKST